MTGLSDPNTTGWLSILSKPEAVDVTVVETLTEDCFIAEGPLLKLSLATLGDPIDLVQFKRFEIEPTSGVGEIISLSLTEHSFRIVCSCRYPTELCVLVCPRDSLKTWEGAVEGKTNVFRISEC